MVNLANYGLNFQVFLSSLLFILDKCLPPTASLAGLVLCEQVSLVSEISCSCDLLSIEPMYCRVAFHSLIPTS